MIMDFSSILGSITVMLHVLKESDLLVFKVIMTELIARLQLTVIIDNVIFYSLKAVASMRREAFSSPNLKRLINILLTIFF